ncbi:8199_t:CDS:1, partial [Funneliformis caledonium]
PLNTTFDVEYDYSLDGLHADYNNVEIYFMYTFDLGILLLGSLCT